MNATRPQPRPQPRPNLRSRQLAAIHIAASKLLLTDDDYRIQVRLHSGGHIDPDTQVCVGGRDSAADLTGAQRGALLTTLQRRMIDAGLIGRPRTVAAARQVRRGPAAVSPERADIAAKIAALLLDAGRGDAYASAIARSRWGVQRWEWLPFAEQEALLQMLIIDQVRRVLRRILAALAAGRPPLADLTPGEIEHGADVAAVRDAVRRKLVALVASAEPDGDPVPTITPRGRDWLAAQPQTGAAR